MRLVRAALGWERTVNSTDGRRRSSTLTSGSSRSGISHYLTLLVPSAAVAGVEVAGHQILLAGLGDPPGVISRVSCWMPIPTSN